MHGEQIEGGARPDRAGVDMTASPDLPLETLDAVAARWAEHDPAAWRGRPERYVELARRALELGHPSLAFDVAKAGLDSAPDHPELIFRAALALARGGATATAAERLGVLVETLDVDHPLFAEALSLAGRLAKDRWGRLEDGDARLGAARESARLYARAYSRHRDPYPGVNAASMALLSGDVDRARSLATEVLGIGESSLTDAGPDDYWLAAILGECALILEDRPRARRWYGEAARRVGRQYGELASMRRQVRHLADALGHDDEVWELLAVPRVVVFTGHMIDAPDRPVERFPARIEAEVSKAIASTLDRLDARFGYCSAACGADLLFLEAMLARGGEVHVLLPFRRDDFVEASVSFAGSDWIRRFENALENATSVRYATEEDYLGDDVLFAYTAELATGQALLRADQLETEAVMLGVLDSAATGGIGGTADTVREWRAKGRRVEIIELAPIRGTGDEARDVAPIPQPEKTRPTARSIQAMLFADVVGFSRLGEAAAPSFFVDFLGAIAEVIETHPVEPAFQNTWGDGLFLVYDDLRTAADLALRLRDRVAETDWSRVGLPADTSVRIGMHAGPVYAAHDPILGQRNFFGSHVNRAARIEPVTTPGSVFVSEQTASLLAAAGGDDFACDYLGRVPLAKEFGTGPLYRLRRANRVE